MANITVIPYKEPFLCTSPSGKPIYYSSSEIKGSSASEGLIKLIQCICKTIRNIFSPSFSIHLDSEHQNYPAVANLKKRGYQLRDNTLITYLDAKGCNYVKTCIFRETKITAEEVFNKLQGKDSVSIPVTVKSFFGYHIVNIKCRLEADLFKIEFFDSQGRSIADPKNRRAFEIIQTLEQRWQNVIIEDSPSAIQKDVHSCGVFVAHHIESSSQVPPADINEFRKEMGTYLAGIPKDLQPDSLNDDF